MSPSEGTAGPSRQLALQLGPVAPAAREIALTMDLERNAEFITEQILQIVFPDRVGNAEFRDLMFRNAYDNLRAMWRIIAGADDLEVTPPRGAIEFNDAAATMGVPLGQFERIYRVGVGLTWTLWFGAATTHAEREGADLAPLLAGPSMIIHAYIDGQIQTLLERYEVAQAEHRSTREQLQRTVLAQVLDGLPEAGAADVERSLGIPLEADHLAVALRVERDGDEAAVADRLARVCGARGTALTYPVSRGCWVIWLTRPDGFGPDTAEELRTELTKTGLFCALGDPAWGLAGLTSTAQEALEASRLRDGSGGPVERVVSFDDYRLESLLLADPAKARRFVRAELRGLDADDARSATLRDTVQVWLTCGSNVATAQLTGQHEHTVRNRIKAAADLIGRAPSSRRTELLVALRLRRLLTDR